MFAALAEGQSQVRNFLPGGDCRATLGVMRALGVESTKEIAVLVVTPTGGILARVSGRYSEEAAVPIERALSAGG